jgi:N-acetylglucosaminyl-diphospho-decaprenol L-rhamnosyltransferase
MSDAGIIMVSFNTRDLTLACLRSAYKQTQGARFEVIVVDNASTDGSAEAIAAEFPDVRLIASDVNLGFAAANNRAARGATGTYILLLNPDTVVLGGAIDRIVAFAEAHPDYGIYGGRTMFGDGSLNPTSVWRKPTVWNMFCRASGLSALAKDSPVFSADMYGGWARDTVREVDMVSGCFLLIHRALWERLGGFDTSYFMYGEDWDLCLRARALGARCLFCPEAEIIHYGGASEPVRADKLVRLFQSKVKLFRAHWGFVRSRLLILMLWVWIARCVMMDSLLGALGRPARRDAARAWRDVARRHREWMATDTPA